MDTEKKVPDQETILIKNPNDYPFGPLSNDYFNPMTIYSVKWKTVTNFILSNLVVFPFHKSILRQAQIKGEKRDTNLEDMFQREVGIREEREKRKLNSWELDAIKGRIAQDISIRRMSIYQMYARFLYDEYFYTVRDAVELAYNAKFLQNPDAQQLLLSTGNLPLVYVSKDNILGVNPDTNQGENVIGLMLMQIRHNLYMGKYLDAKTTRQNLRTAKITDTYRAYLILERIIRSIPLQGYAPGADVPQLEKYKDLGAEQIVNLYYTSSPKSETEWLVNLSDETLSNAYSNDNSPLLRSIFEKEGLLPGSLYEYMNSNKYRLLLLFNAKKLQAIVRVYLSEIIRESYPDLTEEEIYAAVSQSKEISSPDIRKKIVDLYNSSSLSPSMMEKIQQKLDLLSVPDNNKPPSIPGMEYDPIVESKDALGLPSVPEGDEETEKDGEGEFMFSSPSSGRFGVGSDSDSSSDSSVTEKKSPINKDIKRALGDTNSVSGDTNSVSGEEDGGVAYLIKARLRSGRKLTLGTVSASNKNQALKQGEVLKKEYLKKHPKTKITGVYSVLLKGSDQPSREESKTTSIMNQIISGPSPQSIDLSPPKEEDAWAEALDEALLQKPTAEAIPTPPEMITSIKIYDTPPEGLNMFSPFFPDRQQLEIDGLKYPSPMMYIIACLLTLTGETSKGVDEQGEYEEKGDQILQRGTPISVTRMMLIKFDNFITPDQGMELYNSEIKDTIISMSAVLAHKALKAKFKNHFLATTLKLTGDAKLVWNDKTNFVLGGAVVSKKGEEKVQGYNWVGQIMMNIRDSLKNMPVSESDLINSKEVYTWLTHDQYLFSWFKMRLSDMCNTVSTVYSYLKTSAGVDENIDPKFVNRVLDTFYTPCSDIMTVSQKYTKGTPSENFISLVEEYQGIELQGLKNRYNIIVQDYWKKISEEKQKILSTFYTRIPLGKEWNMDRDVHILLDKVGVLPGREKYMIPEVVIANMKQKQRVEWFKRLSEIFALKNSEGVIRAEMRKLEKKHEKDLRDAAREKVTRFKGKTGVGKGTIGLELDYQKARLERWKELTEPKFDKVVTNEKLGELIRSQQRELEQTYKNLYKVYPQNSKDKTERELWEQQQQLIAESNKAIEKLKKEMSKELSDLNDLLKVKTQNIREISGVYWQRLIALVSFLTASLPLHGGQVSPFEVKKALVKIENFISRGVDCNEIIPGGIYINKELISEKLFGGEGCVVSALYNILQGIQTIKRFFLRKTGLSVLDMNAAVDILLGRRSGTKIVRVPVKRKYTTFLKDIPDGEQGEKKQPSLKMVSAVARGISNVAGLQDEEEEEEEEEDDLLEQEMEKFAHIEAEIDSGEEDKEKLDINPDDQAEDPYNRAQTEQEEDDNGDVYADAGMEADHDLSGLQDYGEDAGDEDGDGRGDDGMDSGDFGFGGRSGLGGRSAFGSRSGFYARFEAGGKKKNVLSSLTLTQETVLIFLIRDLLTKEEIDEKGITSEEIRGLMQHFFNCVKKVRLAKMPRLVKTNRINFFATLG